MSNNKKWSSDYPTHLVIPPLNSIEINKVLFRFVINREPDHSDFLPSFKDPSQRHLGRRANFRNNPRFYGTSFFNTESKMKSLQEESPEKFSEKRIAKGAILPKHGKGEIGKSEHVSMWFYEGVYPEGFKVI